MFIGPITKRWDDKPVVIVGAGPSLLGFNFMDLFGWCHILAIKEAAFDIPFADAGFGIDIGWMKRREQELGALRVPMFLAVPDDGSKEFPVIPNVRYVRRRQGLGLSPDNPTVNAGQSSGFGALNFAFHHRPKKIILLGFDYGVMHGIEGIVHHYDNGRYPHYNPQRIQPWWQWARVFDTAAAQLTARGVEVVNACPTSAITAFPRVSLPEVIHAYARAG